MRIPYTGPATGTVGLWWLRCDPLLNPGRAQYERLLRRLDRFIFTRQAQRAADWNAASEARRAELEAATATAWQAALRRAARAMRRKRLEGIERHAIEVATSWGMGGRSGEYGLRRWVKEENQREWTRVALLAVSHRWYCHMSRALLGLRLDAGVIHDYERWHEENGRRA